MRKIVLSIVIGLVVYCGVSLGQEIYQWVDEKGTIHFTDDPSLIPERFQNQVQKRKTPTEPASIPPDTSTEDKASEGPESERKDLLGRGEGWWRDKAMEWKGKLNKAQKDHAAAQAALEAKEKELEQSVYKPDSLKRRLQAEIRVLEEKVDEQKSQVEEAKNMLEKVLPKQAEEYRADPSWVRIEQ